MAFFREKAIEKNPQIFLDCKIKNNFPLIMAKANAAAILNRFFIERIYKL